MTLVNYFARWTFVGTCSVVTLTNATHLNTLSVIAFTFSFVGATMNGAPWSKRGA